MIGKVRKAKLYIYIGRLGKLHTVELGTSRLKGDGTNRNPLTGQVFSRMHTMHCYTLYFTVLGIG